MTNTRLRLSQVFIVNGLYVPTKASLYFKRAGGNESSYFDLSTGSYSIDATNFSSINQGTNKLIISESLAEFTDNAFLSVYGGVIDPYVSDLFAVVNYPIKTDSPGKYNLYLRGRSESGSFDAEILIDDVPINSISSTPGSIEWTWFSTDFVLPDTDSHNLGIRLEKDNNDLDKIYISKSVDLPINEGPDSDLAPFVTVHLQVYETTIDYIPTVPLPIYDYKTTINEVVIDDWYNFDINTIDNSSLSFDSSYALVVSSSGRRPTNFVVWELADSDEYEIFYSAIKVN